MNHTTSLSYELQDLKSKVIGLAIDDQRTELIVEYKERKNELPYITTLYITNLLAIHTTSGRQFTNQKIILFPNNKSLKQMISNPFEWNEFCKTNDINN